MFKFDLFFFIIMYIIQESINLFIHLKPFRFCYHHNNHFIQINFIIQPGSLDGMPMLMTLFHNFPFNFNLNSILQEVDKI